MTRHGKWVDAFIVFSTLVILGIGIQRYQPYGLAWNATASVPLGMYLTEDLGTGKPLKRGDVVCWRNGSLGKFLDRGYVPENIRVCKAIWGLEGDQVVVENRTLTIRDANGLTLVSAKVSSTDSKQRPMPNALAGMTVVPPGTVVVLSPAIENALDSRYLGPIPLTALNKRITPIWTY